MKTLFTSLLLALGLFISQATLAQDSSKLNNLDQKVSRSERKEARLRKKAERKEKKASRKQKKLAHQEKKSARRERKMNREQRKLQRQQEKAGTAAPSQSAFILSKYNVDGLMANAKKPPLFLERNSTFSKRHA